jgi:hypothetical protein
MGFNEYNFEWIQETFRSLGLKKDETVVCEVGSQQIHYHGNELPVLSYYGQYRGHLYKKYYCLDLHAAPNTVITDLSKPVVIDGMDIQYADFLTNLGTAEHVEPARGQYECWRNMHRLTKKGGVQVHDLPKYGYWTDHCRFWYTEHFCNEIARQNNYTIYGMRRWTDKRSGDGILCTFIKNEDNDFMSYDEFMKVVKFDEKMEIPVGNNNPKNLKMDNTTPLKRVISFCLWGKDLKYERGLIENIKLARIYYPDWICWVYLHLPSTNDIVIELSKFDNVKIIIKLDLPIRLRRFMLWRFEPVNDPEVEYLMSRDVDTRISPREVLAVQEWVDSGKSLHIIRDHPQHYPKILGGMYGIKCSSLEKCNWVDKINKYYEEKGFGTDDQLFLKDYLYDNFTNDRIIHDEIKRYEGDECRPFSIPYEQTFHGIGGYIYEDGSCDPVTTEVLRTWLTSNLPSRISSSSITLEDKLLYIGSKVKNMYIMHYSRLTDRRELLEKQLKLLLLPLFMRVEWIDNFDREDLTPEMIKNNYKYDPDIMVREMTSAEIANGIAHLHIMNNVEGITLIVEDDTIFKKDFVSHLYHVLHNLPENWEILCLGGPCCDIEMPAKSLPGACRNEFKSDEIVIHKPSSPGPATFSCLLINPSGTQKLMKGGICPLSSPIDDMTWVIGQRTDLQMYWCQPWITSEGSKSDIFKTTMGRN